MGEKTTSVLIVAVFFAFMMLFGNASADQIQPISLEELKTKMDAGERIVLVNPLTDIVFNEGYISGSVNIPVHQIMNTDKLPVDKETLIVTYCQGPRCVIAKHAACLIAGKGYRNVKWFREGIQGWTNAGYPLENKNAMPMNPVAGLNPPQLMGKLQDVVVLDIRPPALYEMGCIKGSYKMPMDDLSKKYVELPKGKPIVVVDETGNQVILAARFLEQKGYEVQGLQGGMKSWLNTGYPVER